MIDKYKKDLEELKNKYKNLNLKNESKDFRLKTFVNEKGDFDYEKYVATQELINKKKLSFGGPSKEKMDLIIKDIFKNIGMKKVNFGLCHGTRRGEEQLYFSKRLKKLAIHKIKVIGTEISSTASKFPLTIQWDFHNIKKEWENNVSFIFSNSLDHSYDPIFCISQWIKCLMIDGVIYIQRASDDLPESFIGEKWKTNNFLRPDEEFPADLFQSSHEAFEKIIIPEAIKKSGIDCRIRKIILNEDYFFICVQRNS